ncbi:MAG: FHA domain-containing protein [Vicinamibacteria bacterium]|jgi:hypothetical protein|nr:FHA domain-containing protein [Vicinamibacteria bacterium]
MVEKLSDIETSFLDDLVRIKKDQQELNGLIEKAGSRKEKVNELVLKRVLQDYNKRLDDLEGQARPLRAKAQGEFVRLMELHKQLADALERARLDLEEIEFRHEIGELGDGDYQGKKDAAEKVRTECQALFDEADALRQRFLEVTPEPAPPEPAEPEPEPAPEEITEDVLAPVGDEPSTLTLPNQRIEPPTQPRGRSDMGGETLFVERESKPPAGPKEEFKTVMVAAARLVEEADASKVYPLGVSSTIGRTSENEIVIDTREVSRKHCRIEMSDQGFKVTDLKSGNGTYVNGKRVNSAPLMNGDRLKVGTTVFIFEAS